MFTDRNSLLFELFSITCFGLAFLLILSLSSFHYTDVPFNQWPPKAVTSNAVGPLGAYTAYFLFTFFGFGAYGVPVLLITAGIAVGLHARICWWGKLLLSVFFLVSLAALLELPPSLNLLAKHNQEVFTPGGIIGDILNRYLFVRFLGQTGSFFLLITLLILFFVLIYETEPIRSLIRLALYIKNKWEAHHEEKLLQQKGLLGKLEIAQKKLTKEEKEIQKVLKKQAVSSLRSEDLLHKKTGSLGAFALKNLKEPGYDLSPGTKPSLLEKLNLLNYGKKEKESKKPLPEPPVANSKSPSLDGISGALTTSPPKEKESVSIQSLANTFHGEPKPDKPSSIAGSGGYTPPALHLLQKNPFLDKVIVPEADLRNQAKLLIDTLSSFGIEVSPGSITYGPTITRFELYPAPGVRVDRIKNLQRDIARAMRAERVNILAPIPGKDSVGVELPNAKKIPVFLRDILEHSPWNSSKAKIPLALGKDVYGEPLIADLFEMPHLLIAGATGSGKSVCINAILLSLLYNFGPDQLKMILVDPKQVELQAYNGIAHLIVPVIVDPKKVINGLKWVVQEMERRYSLLAESGSRNIIAYNSKLELQNSSSNQGANRETKDKLPWIVVVIDELADLMQTTPAEVEVAIARLSAKARAAGIHLIVATQTPRREVITGVIKANIPSRIAFQVASSLDSRVILDENGAENLVGKGDFLFLPPATSKLIRGQGAYVSEEEVCKVVEYIKEAYPASIMPQVQEAIENEDQQLKISESDRELVQKCLEIIWQEKRASTSLLQRRLRLGYNRAAWVMDLLEEKGIVGPENGAKPREILVDLNGPIPHI
ncbi:DNA translocase FtsK [Candidatus Methylacidiphilum infernorum]|uniref:DNA segregation ATPase FtsK/SpoIIIE n=1 Tax=Methylacidiphilum infernorum (isolate V4) TaxID=481448 RepID=B3DYX3_METI4|nr:DNA translocase FtsK [Candidatus Methylacidiphilum infernorum]ACD82495.1 DNA segregation ATPase FtsK/SpoIIIE [Methylacidiphilum infernorum V4]